MSFDSSITSLKEIRRFVEQTKKSSLQADSSSPSPIMEPPRNEPPINPPPPVVPQVQNEIQPTIRQLLEHEPNLQPLCIVFPEVEGAFELKPNFVHYLPTFHGLPSEDPHQHLREFLMVCSTMKPVA